MPYLACMRPPYIRCPPISLVLYPYTCLVSAAYYNYEYEYILTHSLSFSAFFTPFFCLTPFVRVSNSCCLAQATFMRVIFFDRVNAIIENPACAFFLISLATPAALCAFRVPGCASFFAVFLCMVFSDFRQK